MTLNKQKTMAFYHSDGMVAAWKQAQKFAGAGGHIITLPEVIDARLANSSLNDGGAPWNMYFTTSSAEYCGRSKSGKFVIIVAHGVGPLSTLDGILKAYAWQYKDRSRNRHGGRISQKDFLRLENGDFGPVSVIDLEELLGRYEYPLMGTLTVAQALNEPLLHARLGARWKEYIDAHFRLGQEWLREKGHSERAKHLGQNLALMDIRGASQCHYKYCKPEPNMAFAHLLSIGSLHIMAGNGHQDSLVCDVSCHGWSDGTRLASTQGSGAVTDIHPGVRSVSSLMRRHWQTLLRPVEPTAPACLSALTRAGDKGQDWFTQVPKQGESMDSQKMNYPVTSLKPVGQPLLFSTEIVGYHGFFRYGLKEMEQIAPLGANAYEIPGEISIAGNRHVCEVQFYCAEVDTSRRMPSEGEVENNFDLLMELLDRDEARKKAQ